MKVPTIETAAGRRGWAFIVLLVGCFIFTCFAAVGVWIVRSNAHYSFVLALAAHLQLLVGMGAFSFILGRRMRIVGNKDGFEFESNLAKTPAEGAALAADAAEQVSLELKEEE